MSVIAKALGLFPPLPIKIATGLVLAFAIMAALFWWQWSSTSEKLADAKADLRAAYATIEGLQKDVDLLQRNALERAADERQSEEEGRELTNAASNPNDDANDRRLRIMCVLWKQRAASGDRLPAACGRFAGKGPAEAERSGL